MLGRTNTGGGSNPLNFKVVGGTSAPASPKENTIWVNTDAEITGWIFSATEPEAPAEGLVWFTTGAVSNAEFNALKKNKITVYPLIAKQYTSGAWVSKTAKSYQNGAWVEWLYYLYNSGDECISISGGWRGINPYDEYGDGTLTKNTSSINLYADSDNRVISAVTEKKIDLSNFKTAKINVTAISSGTEMYLNFYAVEDDLTTAVTEIRITSKGTKSLDISDVSGSYHMMVECYTGNGATAAASITFDKIWLE